MINSQKPARSLRKFLEQWRRRLRCRGQTLVEYALILAVISIVVVGVLVNLQKSVSGIFTTISSQLSMSNTH